MAVDVSYQNQGIGTQLIQITQNALGLKCSIILLSAPAAVKYYPHVGFEHHPQAWTLSKKTKLKTPSGTMSTAEAISVVNSGMALAAHFGDGTLQAADLAASIQGAVLKDPVQDAVIWKEYLETVVKGREGWQDIYRACRELM